MQGLTLTKARTLHQTDLDVTTLAKSPPEATTREASQQNPVSSASSFLSTAVSDVQHGVGQLWSNDWRSQEVEKLLKANEHVSWKDYVLMQKTKEDRGKAFICLFV